MPTQDLVRPKNLLLAALPAADRRRLFAQHEPVELVLGSTLAVPGTRARHAFFPIDGLISLISPINGGSQLEVGLVGNEGMFGVSLVLGVADSPLEGLVQSAGSAWRFDAATFRRELKSCPALQQVTNRYVYVLLSLFAQAAACTRFHFVEPRLARWLLTTRDRAHSNEFYITQEFLSHMLGVRRVGVTRAASALRQRNLIRYSRGNLEILDSQGLEAASCSCYATAKETYAGIFG